MVCVVLCDCMVMWRSIFYKFGDIFLIYFIIIKYIKLVKWNYVIIFVVEVV